MKLPQPQLSDHAGYHAAQDKLTKLQVRRDELRREAREMQNELSKRTHATDDEVDALLADSPVATATVTRDAVAQIRHQQHVTERAIERQRQVVDSARHEASAEIRAKMLPLYKAIVKRQTSILAALREVAVEEHEFRRGLQEAGVVLTNEFIQPFGDCGQPADAAGRQDAIARWEESARRDGMI